MSRIRNNRGLAALVLASALAAAAPAAAQNQVQAYDGAAHIGNLDAITVVYPAAEGALAEIHRDSAELRASYLSRRYGVRTEIVSDAEIDDAQLRGHLLLLGWENSLLGTPEAPRPWKRTKSGLNFLGEGGAARSDDLLFMCGSPYNDAKFLVFWSRIEPELDRFLSFPFVGSDWAIYRDYFILHQGMFDDQTAWPPVRNTYAQHAETFNPPPKVRTSGHYTLHYDSNLIGKELEQRIFEARETALSSAAEMLGVELGDDVEIDLYLYEDQQEKHSRTGVADAVHSVTLRGELHMPTRYARNPNPHEEIHLLAARRFGSCSLSAVYEGLALLLETRKEPERLDAWAALIVERDAVPPLAELIDDERLRQLSGSQLAFPSAALMLDWLLDAGGPEALNAVYPMTRGNAVATMAKAAGLAPDADLDAAFRVRLEERAESGETELAYRTEIAKGEERARVGDFVGAAEAFERALEIKPGDPWMIYRVALCHIETARYDEARAQLQTLLAISPAPEPSWLLIHGTFQLAQIADFEGKRDEAVAGYRKVLAMPDEHEAHRRAREALELLGESE